MGKNAPSSLEHGGKSSGDRRIGCIWLPRFGLSVASRLDPTQPPPPAGTALFRPGTRWQELLECSPELEVAGIRPGLPLKEAQSRFPEAIYLPCDTATLAAIAQAFDGVLAALDAFSPLVEPAESLAAAKAVAYLDVTGLEPLYGPETRLAERVLTAAEAAAEAAGITSGCAARAGIASNKFTAWVAATQAYCLGAGDPHQARAVMVPLGEEASFLAPLPLETLPLGVMARQALQRLSVRTLGDYARLPFNAVTHRYGAAGQRAHRLAQGIDDEPLRPRRLNSLTESFTDREARVEITFDWEETELDRLVFALKALADQLAARLMVLGQPAYAAEALHVVWRLSGGEASEVLLRLAAPSGSAAVFTEHLRWHVDGLGRWLTQEARDEEARDEEARDEEARDEEARDEEARDEGIGWGELQYQTMERRLGVVGIALEAVGIQLPAGTQLKLLASPLQGTGDDLGTASRLDPATRARQARRAIARLQARWGSGAVRQAVATQSRLPEQAFREIEPSIGLQVDLASGAASRLGSSPLLPFGSRLSALASDEAATLAGHMPLWLVEPPEPVRLLSPSQGRRSATAGGRGRLLLVSSLSAVASASSASSTVKGLRIVRFGGPWKLTDPTLLVASQPLRRDYYQLEIEDGRACLVYWDRVTDLWFLQAIFD